MSLPIVQGLAANFPHLEVGLETGWSATLQELINASELDAAIALLGKTAAPSPTSEGRKVGEIDVAIVQSRCHPTCREESFDGRLGNP
jgi:hypothetical protein